MTTNHLQASQGSRNATIDVARGIGIVLVVLGHNALALADDGAGHGNALFRVLFSFHMPLFFFIAGLFIDERVPPGRFLMGRAQSLLKPFFVVLTLIGLAKLAVGASSPGSYFGGMLWANGVTIAWGPLWFLPHLFVAQALAHGWLRAVRGSRHATRLTALLAVALAVIGLRYVAAFWSVDPHAVEVFDVTTLASNRLPGLPWGLDLVGISVACVLCGRLFAEHVKTRSLPIALTLSALLVLAWLHWRFNATIDLNMRRVDTGVVAAAEAVLGVVVVLGSAAWMARFELPRTMLARLGEGSVFILLFHFVIEDRVFKLLAQHHMATVMAAVIALVAAVGVPWLMWEISRRNAVLSMLLLPRTTARRRLASTPLAA